MWLRHKNGNMLLVGVIFKKVARANSGEHTGLSHVTGFDR